MVTPLIPILVAGTLAAGPLALGVIEGTADAVAAFLRLWAGRHSDRFTGRRKALTLAGYALSNAVRPLFSVVFHWLALLVLRSVDRVGKGLRSAQRDAMLADAVEVHRRGAAFGVQRAFDNCGAVLGALVAALALWQFTADIATVIAFSALPGLLAVALVGLAVREPPRRTPPEALPALSWDALGRTQRRILLIVAAFTFARLSDTFIVLRGHQLGLGVVELLLMWASISLMKAGSSYYGGRWSDAVPRRLVLLVSWTAWAAGLWLLCVADTGPLLWSVAIYIGLVAGLGEGAERALVRDHARGGEVGTAFGWYYFLTGLAAIPAGIAVGGLWHWQSAAMAFSFAGAVAALCALLLLVLVKNPSTLGDR
ncbi:MAG: MFS transporter [Betaproteobacteria bacterium]|nr:MFS transporter [Betaproteobacteria bacterium]